MTIIYEKFYPVGYTPVKLCKLIYSYDLDAAGIWRCNQWRVRNVSENIYPWLHLNETNGVGKQIALVF